MLLSAVAYGGGEATTCVHGPHGRVCVPHTTGERAVEITRAVDGALALEPNKTLRFCVAFVPVEGPVAAVTLLTNKCGPSSALSLELRFEQGLLRLKLGGNSALTCPATPLVGAEFATPASVRGAGYVAVLVECDERTVRMRDVGSETHTTSAAGAWPEITEIRVRLDARTNNKAHVAAVCLSGARSKVGIRDAVQMAIDSDANARPPTIGATLEIAEGRRGAPIGMTQGRAEAQSAYAALEELFAKKSDPVYKKDALNKRQWSTSPPSYERAYEMAAASLSRGISSPARNIGALSPDTEMARRISTVSSHRATVRPLMMSSARSSRFR
jgi:hypothetical protein